MKDLEITLVKKKRKVKTFNLRSEIITGIRKAFRVSPLRKSVLEEGRVEKPFVKKDGSVSDKKLCVFRTCQVCGELKQGLFDVDHKDPVIDPEVGFIDWNTYIDRMFCSKDNLQRICRECHDKKSSAERRVSCVKRWNSELDSIDSIETKDQKKLLKKLMKQPEVSAKATEIFNRLF